MGLDISFSCLVLDTDYIFAYKCFSHIVKYINSFVTIVDKEITQITDTHLHKHTHTRFV